GVTGEDSGPGADGDPAHAGARRSKAVQGGQRHDGIAEPVRKPDQDDARVGDHGMRRPTATRLSVAASAWTSGLRSPPISSRMERTQNGMSPRGRWAWDSRRGPGGISRIRTQSFSVVRTASAPLSRAWATTRARSPAVYQ